MFFERPGGGERAILVHLDGQDPAAREDPQEFRELARSAGAETVGFVNVARHQPSAKYLIGSGKVEELRDLVKDDEVELVKALRTVGCQMGDAYVDIRRGELWLHNLRIDPYAPAAMNNHQPDRTRKLLAHRGEIDKLVGQAQQQGLTFVATRVYPKGRRIKVEIALARGKNVADKRQDIKQRDMNREMQRAVREANR